MERYFDGLITVNQKFEGATIQTVVFFKMLFTIGIYFHEEIDNFLYFLTRHTQLAELFVYKFNHL